MPELTIRNLHKVLGDTVVLDGVSFSVAEGEFCVLLGPSGCGKTTLLRVIAGLEPHEGGVVLLDGEDLAGQSPRHRDVAMVFQSYALYPHMTAFDNIAFPLRARKTPKREMRENVERVAGLLGLAGLLGRKPKELSGGQRQRVAIGRAIVREPRLFLFDEPLSNLDAGLRREMRLELAKLHDTLGSTVLYVTHDQVEAMTLADKIVLLHDGRVQQVGPPAEIYARPSNLFVAGFIGSPPMNLLPGILEDEQGRLAFRNDDFEVDLGGYLFEGVETPCRVVLGIRPEALSPEPPDGEAGEPTAACGMLPVRVEMVERLAPEVVVHARCGAARVTARCRVAGPADKGETIRLCWDPADSHLFHADSGSRLHPGDDVSLDSP